MGLREDIVDLAMLVSGGPPSGDPEADFLGAFGLAGDDATEFLDLFAERYEGSLDGILWYFHFAADEPPGHRRVLPVGRDGVIIPFRPITLTQLVRAAEDGRWPFDYPPHSLRRPLFSRLKIVLVCFCLFALFAAAALFPLF